MFNEFHPWQDLFKVRMVLKKFIIKNLKQASIATVSYIKQFIFLIVYVIWIDQELLDFLKVIHFVKSIENLYYSR